MLGRDSVLEANRNLAEAGSRLEHRTGENGISGRCRKSHSRGADIISAFGEHVQLSDDGIQKRSLFGPAASAIEIADFTVDVRSQKRIARRDKHAGTWRPAPSVYAELLSDAEKLTSVITCPCCAIVARPLSAPLENDPFPPLKATSEPAMFGQLQNLIATWQSKADGCNCALSW